MLFHITPPSFRYILTAHMGSIVPGGMMFSTSEQKFSDLMNILYSSYFSLMISPTVTKYLALFKPHIFQNITAFHCQFFKTPCIRAEGVVQLQETTPLELQMLSKDPLVVLFVSRRSNLHLLGCAYFEIR